MSRESRRRGVARAILGCADQLAEIQGLVGVRLVVNAQNEVGQKLYASAGYQMHAGFFCEKKRR
ncbi:MAG: hypothetical protein AB1331_04045 [Bacillota bacterium]